MGKKKSKKNKAPKVEEVFHAIKILCVMSFVGFILAILVDTGNYMSFSSVEELKTAINQAPYEKLETTIDKFESVGLDVSQSGLDRVAFMYLVRTLIDILAMVGVVLMFFEIRKGLIIYTIFQFIYVLVPFLFFGGVALVVIPYKSVAITLIYVALFTSQRKYLVK